MDVPLHELNLYHFHGVTLYGAVFYLNKQIHIYNYVFPSLELNMFDVRCVVSAQTQFTFSAHMRATQLLIALYQQYLDTEPI